MAIRRDLKLMSIPAEGQIETGATRPRRTALSIVRGTLLNLAAAGGLVCIVLVILAVVFNITLIMFKTGSMAPTIPAGSLAVVKQIPASDAHVGDVVTIDRPDALPISHRVVSTHPAGGGFTSIVVKGDANATADTQPYVVKTVRLVLWSAPGLASVVVWLSNPFVLAAITLAVAALVTWVFWPAKAHAHASGQTPSQAARGKERRRRAQR